MAEKKVTVRFNGSVNLGNKAVGLPGAAFARAGEEKQLSESAAKYLVESNPAGLVEIVESEKPATRGRGRKAGGGDE